MKLLHLSMRSRSRCGPERFVGGFSGSTNRYHEGGLATGTQDIMTLTSEEVGGPPASGLPRTTPCLCHLSLGLLALPHVIRLWCLKRVVQLQTRQCAVGLMADQLTINLVLQLLHTRKLFGSDRQGLEGQIAAWGFGCPASSSSDCIIRLGTEPLISEFQDSTSPGPTA